MSKKSRKRNKKILAALALAGGAAMLAKGRGKGIAQGVSGADKAAFTSDAAYKLPSKAAVATDIAADVVPHTSDFQTKYKRKVDGNWITPGTSGVLDRVTDVRHPVLGQSTARPDRFGRIHANTPMRAYKGGGIAKRGTGAAYKSGGRVKSMGIAKRGGGAAKR